MPQFRKKPVAIEAEQYPGPDTIIMDVLGGICEVEPGDWIITGMKGERYPCKPDIFEATHELVDDVGNPANLADGPTRILALTAEVEQLRALAARTQEWLDNFQGEAARIEIERFRLQRVIEVYTDALGECRNLTHLQEASPSTVREVGERVGQIVGDALSGRTIEQRQLEVEQLRVQLAGCLTAAEGHIGPDHLATPDSYGWSPAYQAVVDLRIKFQEAMRLAVEIMKPR